MKFFAGIFWISTLFWFSSGLCQTTRVFTSLEEANAVSSDSVFRLDLSKRRLTEIPPAIYQFKNLVELNLSQNKLVTLPDDFYFPKLEVLNIEKNNLDTFPACICKLTTLKNLYLGRNEIKSIPECIGALQNLVTLDVWFNLISDLPQALTTMKNLRYMDLRGITYSNDFQKKWNSLLPWMKIEFDVGCDCAN